MLFFLTGNIQIGKSRWLKHLVSQLKAHEIDSYGVISPGDWVCSDGPNANSDGFEKLGINSILLPENELITFARRRDLALEEGAYSSDSQSAKAGLGWEISDEAISKVNNHFEKIAETHKTNTDKPSFLIVDELGCLELIKNQGLSSAVSLLEKGPTTKFPSALAVVREDYLPLAESRFSLAWEEMCSIAPDNKALKYILETYGV